MFNDSSLKDFRGRLPVPVVTPRGNFHRTVIRAPLWVKNGANYEADPIRLAAGNVLFALMFLQDSPIYQVGQMRFPSEVVQYTTSGLDTVDITYDATVMTTEAPSVGSTATTGFSQILIPDTAGSIPPKQNVKGLTPTNRVRVSGYPLGYSAGLNPPRVQNPFGTIEVISEGAVLSGQQLWGGLLDTQAGVVQQIVLNETAYTQAIQDAGDVIDYTFGPIRILLEVVGIWSLYQPIIP
jgi:hypothetical protein